MSEIANLYPLVHTKAFYDGLTSEGGTDAQLKSLGVDGQSTLRHS